MSKRLDVKTYRGFFAITLLCLAILYAPLAVVTLYSFNASPSITVWEGLSLRWYADVFTGPESGKFKRAAYNSFTIALIAASVATAIAVAAATAIVRGGRYRLRLPSLGLITLPIMVPEIVLAVATPVFFHPLRFTRGYFSSETRRVGEKGRSRRSPDPLKKKTVYISCVRAQLNQEGKA